MPLTFDKVHRYTRIPGTLEMRLVETTPYVRLREGYDPPLFIQGGKVYDEAGVVVEPWPEWVTAAIAKLTPVVRAEVGLALPGPSGLSPTTPAPARATSRGNRKPGEPWTCECGWMGTTRSKHFHYLNHHKPKEPQA